MCPWHSGNVLTVAHPMSRVLTADLHWPLAVSESTSLSRCCSPSQVDFPSLHSAYHHLSPWEHTWSFTTDLNVPHWKVRQSPLSWHCLLQWTYCTGVQVMHMSPSWVSLKSLLLLEVGQSGTWEMSYIYHPFLSKRYCFSYDFAGWVLGSCPIPADGNAGC